MAALFLALFSAWLLFAFALTRPVQAQMKPAPTDKSLIWPLSGTTIPDATISSLFGPRWQASQHRYDYHAGIDIAAPAGTPIHTIAGGTVFKVGWLSDDAGLGVVLRHADLGFYSAYLHLNSTPVTVSQVITHGQIIGYVGNSGTTNCYHVHTEIRLTATDYPTSTRNVMGYLPRPDTTTPTIQISSLQSTAHRPAGRRIRSYCWAARDSCTGWQQAGRHGVARCPTPGLHLDPIVVAVLDGCPRGSYPPGAYPRYAVRRHYQRSVHNADSVCSPGRGTLVLLIQNAPISS